MDSSVQEMSNPTPREVDLFAEEALEEVFETIDNLRSQFDQLQIHCEKLAAEKAKVDQLVIDKETEWQLSKERLQEEIGNLRKVNLQLLASQKSFNQGTVDLGSFVVDSEKVYQEKVEAETKVDTLQLQLLEKDKYISSLEWQLVDCEATIASIQVERDRLALELDITLGREQEDLHSLGAVGDSSCRDNLEQLDRGLVESGYVDDMPVRRIRKQPRRHLSDLTTRGNSHLDDFGAVVMVNTSLSDYDVPRLAEKELKGLGNLKRAANFSNINNLDENETFSDKANLNHSQWESFDDTDGALPALSKNKFSDVADANDGRNTGNPDMWSFTPDSIINVSTGEELSADEGRRLSKDMNAIAADNGHMDNHIDDMMTNDVNTGKKASQTDRPRSNTDVPLRANHKLLSESVCAPKNFKDRDNIGKIASSSNANRLDGPTRHLTRRSASDVSSNKKLEEYHKWKVSGCKGDPPAKLKISQC